MCGQDTPSKHFGHIFEDFKKVKTKDQTEHSDEGAEEDLVMMADIAVSLVDFETDDHQSDSDPCNGEAWSLLSEQAPCLPACTEFPCKRPLCELRSVKGPKRMGQQSRHTRRMRMVVLLLFLELICIGLSSIGIVAIWVAQKGCAKGCLKGGIGHSGQRKGSRAASSQKGRPGK